MALIFNILWWITGGFLLGLGWYLAGILMAISIIGLPWARAAFEMGNLCIAPFGKRIVSVDEVRNARAIWRRDPSEANANPALSFFGVIAALLWLPLGILLLIGHVLQSIPLFLSIIGIPFAIQNLKIAGFALFPVGRRVVNEEMADIIRQDASRRDLYR
jgi:uncharacterized membrane protein YccF (DUF307 family)